MGVGCLDVGTRGSLAGSKGPIAGPSWPKTTPLPLPSDLGRGGGLGGDRHHQGGIGPILSVLSFMLTPEVIHDFVNAVDVYYIVMLSYLSKEIIVKDFSIQHVTVKNDAFNRFFVEDW